MKYILSFLVLLVFLTGCTYKNNPLSLNSYDARYAGPLSKEHKSVLVRVVKDIRSQKQTIGQVLDNGKTLANLYTHVNFEAKYQEGLLYALRMAGFDTDTTTKTAQLVVEVFIKDIEIIYNDKNFDTNLKGEIEIEVLTRKNDEVITQTFRQKSGKWIKPTFDSQELEPFLHDLFSDSIDQIVSRLARL